LPGRAGQEGTSVLQGIRPTLLETHGTNPNGRSGSGRVYNHEGSWTLEGEGFSAVRASDGRDGSACIRPIGNSPFAGAGNVVWQKETMFLDTEVFQSQNVARR
jgi:hypothetical protein